ncbi:PKD domain-containing protein [Candidatus Poribacteria bacterium]
MNIRKGKTVARMSCAMILAIVFLAAVSVNVDAATITVPDDHPTIQQAVNVASSGDTVYVRSGTYYEHVTIDKSLILQGEDRNTTIINGGGTGKGIYVTANYVTIERVTATNNERGICLITNYTINHVVISDCVVTENIIRGIEGGHVGGYITIENCEVSRNGVSGIYSHQFDNSVIKDCKVFENGADVTGSNRHGIDIAWCSNSSIINCDVYSNEGHYGIVLDSTWDCVVEGCRVWNNNSGIAIYRWGNGYNNTIRDNVVENNTVGIQLNTGHLAYDNLIYHNDIIGNVTQATDGANNSWDNGYPSGGNYWSDYTGVDSYSGPNQDQLGSDGIGDTPHSFDFGQDKYPLMGPYAANQPPIANAGGSYVSDEGYTIAFDASASSDPDNDPLQYRWDFNNDGAWDTGWSSDPIAGYTWNDDHTGTVAAEVSDGQLTDTNTASVTVNNVPPTVNAITAPVEPVDIGNQPTIVSAAFTDPGTLDTHTAVWDWGNGDQDTVGNAINPVSGEKTYSTPGVYTVTLTVTDDDGGSGESVYQYVVIYDPDGGFVTGGGWIYSEPGYYIPDPLLEDKANFGFVSKYKKGATVPTGNTEFNFEAGDMNFHSNEYQWLVIDQNDTNAQYKGSGTINGDPDPNGELYKFMLWAKDLDPDEDDTFRIKIWYEVGDTENVVYDNGFDQPIGGGNIKIHGGGNSTAPMRPSEFTLLQNYPNAFNPETWIPYQLPADMGVAIRIYNISGRLVRTLDLGHKSAGFYTSKDKAAYWDGRNESGEHVSSGIYFYNIQAGEFTATKKMTVAK